MKFCQIFGRNGDWRNRHLGSRLKQARFSARTFFSHCEHVYMLSPSSVSFTVTSSSDWYRLRISVTF
jgi:hypothetical protein